MHIVIMYIGMHACAKTHRVSNVSDRLHDNP